MTKIGQKNWSLWKIWSKCKDFSPQNSKNKNLPKLVNFAFHLSKKGEIKNRWQKPLRPPTLLSDLIMEWPELIEPSNFKLKIVEKRKKRETNQKNCRKLNENCGNYGKLAENCGKLQRNCECNVNFLHGYMGSQMLPKLSSLLFSKPSFWASFSFTYFYEICLRKKTCCHSEFKFSFQFTGKHQIYFHQQLKKRRKDKEAIGGKISGVNLSRHLLL